MLSCGAPQGPRSIWASMFYVVAVGRLLAQTNWLDPVAVNETFRGEDNLPDWPGTKTELGTSLMFPETGLVLAALGREISTQDAWNVAHVSRNWARISGTRT